MAFGAGALAGQKQFSAAATAVINALWAALDHEEHCKYILHGRHLTESPIAEGREVMHVFSLHNVIKALSHNVAAQLTAAACQVHLCLVEIYLQSTLPPKTGTYCKAVVAADILDDVFKAVLTGLKVTAHPLSTCSLIWQYTCMRPHHDWAIAVVVIKMLHMVSLDCIKEFAGIANTFSFLFVCLHVGIPRCTPV